MKEWWFNIYEWDGFRYRIRYLSIEAAKLDNLGKDMTLLYRIHVRLK